MTTRQDYPNSDEPDEGAEDNPNDPDHPDFDLSDAGGDHYHYEISSKPWYVRRWVMLLIAILVILGLLLPILPR